MNYFWYFKLPEHQNSSLTSLHPLTNPLGREPRYVHFRSCVSTVGWSSQNELDRKFLKTLPCEVLPRTDPIPKVTSHFLVKTRNYDKTMQGTSFVYRQTHKFYTTADELEDFPGTRRREPTLYEVAPMNLCLRNYFLILMLSSRPVHSQSKC